MKNVIEVIGIANETGHSAIARAAQREIDEMTARIAKLETALGEVIQMLEDYDDIHHGLLSKADGRKLYKIKDLLKGG